MKCDICGKEFSVITLNQFNTIMFGIQTGNSLGIKAAATCCNECCDKVIKFIDGISMNDHGGIVL